MKTLRLKPGKERSLQRRHPWIFDSAIAKGSGDAGETVRVEASDGQFLAWAFTSPASKISARVWSFDEAQRIDASFFIAKVQASTKARSRFDIKSDGQRLIHGESDGLPGLIVDQYGDTLVAQFLSTGAERWKTVLTDALLAATGLTKLYERSDTNARKLEGLAPAAGWLRGDGPVELTLREHGWQLSLDIATGHKTGFYLDQRDSRQKFCRTTRSASVSSACSTAFATPAASAWRGAARGGAGSMCTMRSTRPARRWSAAARHVAAERLRCGRGARLAGRRRERHAAAPFSNSVPTLRRHRARPSEVRADGGPRRARVTRLQGHQPPRAGSCWSPAACCSRSRARAASAPPCSTRSSPAPGSTPGSTATCSNGWRRRRTTRRRWNFPEGEYLKGLIDAEAGLSVTHRLAHAVELAATLPTC